MGSNHDLWHEKSLLCFNYKNNNDQHPKISPSHQNCQQLPSRPPSPIKHLILMKFWLSSRGVLRNPNPDRIIPSHTLHSRYSNSLQLSHPYLSRRQLRLNPPLPPRQRSLHILYLPLSARRPRPLLWIIYPHWNLKYWHSPPVCCNSNSIHGLRTTMRTNILLRGNRYYKSPISHPLYRHRPGRMNLRRLLGRQSNPYSILCLSLPPPIYYRSYSDSSPSISTWNRVQQPHRHPVWHGRYPIPPLLHNQGRPRILDYDHNTANPSIILSRPSRGPRQLHPGQPIKYPTTYQARMILPIRLRNSTFDPQQTRWSSGPSPLYPSPSYYSTSPYI